MTPVTPGLPYILSRSKTYARGNATSSARKRGTTNLRHILSHDSRDARITPHPQPKKGMHRITLVRSRVTNPLPWLLTDL